MWSVCGQYVASDHVVYMVSMCRHILPMRLGNLTICCINPLYPHRRAHHNILCLMVYCICQCCSRRPTHHNISCVSAYCIGSYCSHSQYVSLYIAHVARVPNNMLYQFISPTWPECHHILTTRLECIAICCVN